MIELEVSWSELKKFIDERKIRLNWFEERGNYFIKALDSGMVVSTFISKHDPTDVDLQDFEANYKADGNKVLSTDHALTANVFEVPATRASVQLMGVNTDRKGYVLYNQSPYRVFITYGTEASSTKFTMILEALSMYETGGTVFKGAIFASWDSLADEGIMRVTEMQ